MSIGTCRDPGLSSDWYPQGPKAQFRLVPAGTPCFRVTCFRPSLPGLTLNCFPFHPPATHVPRPCPINGYPGPSSPNPRGPCLHLHSKPKHWPPREPLPVSERKEDRGGEQHPVANNVASTDS